MCIEKFDFEGVGMVAEKSLMVEERSPVMAWYCTVMACRSFGCAVNVSTCTGPDSRGPFPGLLPKKRNTMTSYRVHRAAALMCFPGAFNTMHVHENDVRSLRVFHPVARR
jgi:hypothetical protein